jgi:cytochrome P450
MRRRVMELPAPEQTVGLPRVIADVRRERAAHPRLPPGETGFNLLRTHRLQRDSLRVLLDYRGRYGPVFTLRVFHRLVVFMLGPEANHFVTVSGADHFSWRRGMFGEQLIPLLGDGLITTDGDYHDRARRIMMPAFHARRMEAAVEVMVQEAARALDGWEPGTTLDVYAWMRDVAIRIAMRALLGFHPDDRAGHEAARLFERALSFYDTETWMMLLRGPGSPWSRFQRARRLLDEVVRAEIERRRKAGETLDDVLSMLIATRDEDGTGFSDRELRDHVMTLLFAGHDTSSSTLSFLLYELASNPRVLQRVLDEQDRVLNGHVPDAAVLAGELPELDMALAETLRLYPPVWFGPRLAASDFVFGGYRIPAGTHIVHSSWVTHHLPDVFEHPEKFVPERFTPEARRALPQGAYIPFGGGSRICIGKRFGQLVVKAVATILLQRVRPELPPEHRLRITKVPTLSPAGGLPMVRRPRAAK